MVDNAIDIPAISRPANVAGTEIFVARGGRLLGSIIVADTVRPEAKRAVEALQRVGIRTVLLTGDAKRVATAVGSILGINEIEAELLPENKLTRVRAMVGQKRVVAMVGDGVNDAPALTEANVGVAIGSGTDVAQESADVVLLGNDLERFVETLAVARRTRGIIWQNFAGTIGVDTLGILLAAFGFLNPLLAAGIHWSQSWSSSSIPPAYCRRRKRSAAPPLSRNLGARWRRRRREDDTLQMGQRGHSSRYGRSRKRAFRRPFAGPKLDLYACRNAPALRQARI